MMIAAIGCLACLALFLHLADRAPLIGGEASDRDASPRPDFPEVRAATTSLEQAST